MVATMEVNISAVRHAQRCRDSATAAGISAIKVSPNPADVLFLGGHHDYKSDSCAAQYLRMSTEHQQYSLENQSIAVRRYSEAHGFEIVQTYSDAAKSGLVLTNRPGLRQLLRIL